MPTESPHRRLMTSSRDRSAGLEKDLRSGPPAPGDLFVLRATADLPVEWALLERGTGGKLLAVPADPGPHVGTADVEIPEDAPGGPLSLRCRFSIWLDAALFEPELRSGALAAESVAEALHRIRQIESGTLEGSPLAEEVDADPEYQDWSRDVLKMARTLASQARPMERPGSSAGSWSGAHRLAAALAVLAVGLSLWVALLRREVDHLSDRLSEAVFNVPSEEVPLGATSRGGLTFSVPEGASHVLLVLVVDESIEAREGRFEIADRKGTAVWTSGLERLIPEVEHRLMVPRSRLPDGTYRVRILPASGGLPLAEETLKIETRDETP